MSTKCIFFYEPIKIKSFKTFLHEVNYGAFEKDERIKEISIKIKDDIVDKFKHNIGNSKIKLSIPVKTKNPVIKPIILNWKFNIEKNKNNWISTGAGFDKISDSEYIIIFDINKNPDIDNDEFKDKLLRFVNGGEINKFLYHEVKHLLDELDGIYTYDKYHEPTDSYKDNVKYISQDKEIHNYLLSVISDLENIHKKHPEYTYEKAIENSNTYQSFFRYLIPSKRNKYKVKVAHFWYKNFVN